jgi:hypothetical protein
MKTIIGRLQPGFAASTLRRFSQRFVSGRVGLAELESTAQSWEDQEGREDKSTIRYVQSVLLSVCITVHLLIGVRVAFPQASPSTRAELGLRREIEFVFPLLHFPLPRRPSHSLPHLTHPSNPSFLTSEWRPHHLLSSTITERTRTRRDVFPFFRCVFLFPLVISFPPFPSIPIPSLPFPFHPSSPFTVKAWS